MIRNSRSYSLARKLALMVGVCLASTTVGVACDQCGGGLYGRLGWGGWGQSSPYSLGQVPVPPYFALHPPVYYSTPVPRTYGYSPFAYSGNTPTPEIASQVAPAVIENPYCAPTSDGSSPADSEMPAPADASASAKSQSNANASSGPGPGPKLVLNPFVTRSPEIATVELAKSLP